jgi:Ca2+-binding EF-hand superfamily protein
MIRGEWYKLSNPRMGGEPFYFNKRTGAVTREVPPCMQLSPREPPSTFPLDSTSSARRSERRFFDPREGSPPSRAVRSETGSAAPPCTFNGWCVSWDESSKRRFYVHLSSGASTWSRPDCVPPDSPCDGLGAIPPPPRAMDRNTQAAHLNLRAIASSGSIAATVSSTATSSSIGVVVAALDRAAPVVLARPATPPPRFTGPTFSSVRPAFKAAVSPSSLGGSVSPGIERREPAANRSVIYISVVKIQTLWRGVAARKLLKHMRHMDRLVRARNEAERVAALCRAKEGLDSLQSCRESHRRSARVSAMGVDELSIRRLRLAQLRARIAFRREAAYVSVFRQAWANRRSLKDGAAARIQCIVRQFLARRAWERAARTAEQQRILAMQQELRRVELEAQEAARMEAERRAEAARKAQEDERRRFQDAARLREAEEEARRAEVERVAKEDRAAAMLQAAFRGRLERARLILRRKTAWKEQLRSPSTEQLSRLFRFLDTDSDGKLTKQEWLRGTTLEDFASSASSREILKSPFLPSTCEVSEEAVVGAMRGAKRSSQAVRHPLRRTGGFGRATVEVVSNARRGSTLTMNESVQIFRGIDVDGSESVEESEFIAFFRSCKDPAVIQWMADQLAKLLEVEVWGVDVDKFTERARDRRIRAFEGAAFTSRLRKQRQRVRQFISLCDKDGDGELSVQEILAIFKSGNPSCPLTVNGALQMQLFRIVDVNGDGSLEPGEFEDAVQQRQLPEFHDWLDAFFLSRNDGSRSLLDRIVTVQPPQRSSEDSPGLEARAVFSRGEDHRELLVCLKGPRAIAQSDLSRGSIAAHSGSFASTVLSLRTAAAKTG